MTYFLLLNVCSECSKDNELNYGAWKPLSSEYPSYKNTSQQNPHEPKHHGECSSQCVPLQTGGTETHQLHLCSATRLVIFDTLLFKTYFRELYG